MIWGRSAAASTATRAWEAMGRTIVIGFEIAYVTPFAGFFVLAKERG